MFCPKCGTKRTDGSAFCADCGNRFPDIANKVRVGASNAPHSQTRGNQRYGVPYAQDRTSSVSNVTTRHTTRRKKGFNKKALVIGSLLVVALIVILAITLGGNRGGLTGTWEDREGNEWVFSDSNVWIISYFRDGGVSNVSEATYFTIDNEIRFYGLPMGEIYHFNIDGNNLFLGPMALTRVNSNQSPAPLDPRGITGTWYGEVRQLDGDDYIETITFSGDSFTTTAYRVNEVAFRQIRERDPHAPIIVEIPPQEAESGFTRLFMRGLQTEFEQNDATVVHFFTQRETYFESDFEIHQFTGRGTFSVNGNIIEFVLSDGSTITRNFFFSTEDILNIGGSIVTKDETRR